MNIVALMTGLLNHGADFTPMFKEWIRLSDEKGYPKTEEGWRRFLLRATDCGKFAKVDSPAPDAAKKSDPPPSDFVEWWSRHSHSNGGPPANVAWNCQDYRAEWDKSKLLAA